jgi:DNA-binding MarR family transcriptional regulator
MNTPEGQLRELLLLLMRFGNWIRRERRRLEHGAAPVDVPKELAEQLTARHTTAVMQLFLHGSLTVGELAERLDVTMTTASLVATDIERARLIQRERDPEDRRRVLLRLDPRLAEYMIDRRIAPLRRTLARLDPGERDAFVKGVGILVEEFEEL